MHMNNDDTKKRMICFDYLKVFAAFAVIMIHVSYQNWFSVEVNTFNWQVMNFFNGISRWGIMIFIMISGALFLNKDISIKKLYSKYILHLVIVFFVWSIFYAFLNFNTTGLFVETFLYGYYHMWFILSLIGVYMCIPLIRLIVKDKKITEYYLIISFIFAFLIPTIFYIGKYFNVESLNSLGVMINRYGSEIKPSVVLGYTSFFVLGYYLNNIELNKKQRNIIYVLGIIGFILTVLLNSSISIISNVHQEVFFDNFSVNLLLETIAIFTLFKYGNYKNKKLNNIVTKLSSYTLGVYLVHPFILEQLDILFGLNSLTFNPVISIIIIAIIVMIISMLISAILHKIPYIRDYIV